MACSCVGAEPIWVGRGKTSALRIFLLVVVRSTHGNSLGGCVHVWGNCFMLGILVFCPYACLLQFVKSELKEKKNKLLGMLRNKHKTTWGQAHSLC